MPEEPQRILIIRPSALGDVCRTVPVLATLRRAFPDAAIDWLVQEEFAPAILAHPALTEVLPFPRSRFARWWRDPLVGWELLGWLGGLRQRRYDLVFDCQGLGRSGFFSWCTRAPRRVGHAAARELGWLGYTVRHPLPEARHTVARMMSLLAAEGLEPVYDMRLYVAECDRAWWGLRRDEFGAAGRYAVLAPTARWASKRWPAASWAAIVGPLAERGFERVVLVGSPSERDQIEPVIAACDGRIAVSVAGQTTIGQTMAVIAGADLVIANDSAPLHMAVGFDRPCLGLFGPTDPEEVGPFGRPEAVIRRFQPASGRSVNYKDARLGSALMALINPADVLERVDGMLAQQRRSGGGAEARPRGLNGDAARHSRRARS